MAREKKHIWILSLMIISQLLLFLLVIQWLRSQYNDQKRLMSDELTRIYLNTQDELVDTLLFKSYVVPVISKSGSGNTTRMIAITDSICPDTAAPARNLQGRNVVWKGGKGTITIRVDNKGDSLSHIPDTIRIRRTNDDMLLRSVRLIVAHVSDSVKSGNTAALKFKIKPDSAAFIKQFGNKISGAGMRFNVYWNIKPGGKFPVKRTVLINPGNPFSLPGATVTSYSGYLFGKILPQLIFGITLILITGLAFLLSYRSIRSHMIMNSLRNEFIGNITHELRTPVATISVALESLGKYNLRNDPAVTENYIRLASTETKRLEELINRVLDNSVIEDNNALNFIVTDISPIITNTAEMMRQRLDKGGIIDVKLDPGEISVKCDPLFLKGAFINLIENSIRYCDKTPEIKIEAAAENGVVIMKVSDNGPGIPEEYQNKIFEKFFRLPSGNVHNVKGYGLGLSFVRQVMNLHGGTVTVKNLHPGCSFILKMPLAS